MNTETLSLILALIGAITGAAWLIRSKLADIEIALGVHLEEFKEFKGRVVRLETSTAKKARR